MANPITNKVKTGKIPVIKKDLDSGVIAEANNDGTIYLDKSVKNDSPLAKEAIAHEMVHMDQMARGDLNYNDDKVFWKGKQYDRDDMNEGSKSLPWEKEAYNKTKDMKKSPNKYSLSKSAIGTNRNVVTTKLRADADKTAAIGNAVGQVTSKIPTFDEYENQKNNGTETDATELVEDSSNSMNLKNKNKGPFKMKKGKRGDIVEKEVDAANLSGREETFSGRKKIHEKHSTDYGTAYGQRDKDTYGDLSYDDFVKESKKQKENLIKLGKYKYNDSMNDPNAPKSPAKMKSAPITMKAKSSAMKMKSPLHIETSETREFEGNLGDQTGTFTETKNTKKTKEKKESVKSFATACYNEDGSKKAEGTVVDGILCSWKSDEDFDPESEYDTKEETIYDTAFKGEEKVIETPGKPGKANKGYYEALDSKMGAGVEGRANKRVNRKANSAGSKFDRMNDRGKPPTNPETGEAYTRSEYIKNVAGAFAIPDAFVGKRESSTAGSSKTEKSGADSSKDTFVINEDGTTTKVKASGQMNKNNKNKSAFKMKGWNAYKN